MSSVSELTRMSGLMSGLDTESLVKAATANTKNAINARKQKLQTLQWKQEAYRDVISKLSEFQSKYLNILSKDSIRANAVMKAKKAVSSDESLVVTASTSAADGKYSITSVKAATAAKLEGNKASSGDVSLNFSKAVKGENTVKVTLDGTVRNITFEGGETAETAKANFLTALNESFKGVSNAEFSFKDGTNKLTIVNKDDDKVSHIFTVGYNSAVGLENDASNMISSSSTLGSLDFVQKLDGNSFSFTINGKSFNFDKDTTIKDMMNTINKSDAGVKMSFSGLTQSFTLESSATGAGQEISIEQTSGNLINALFNYSTDEIGVSPTKASYVNKTVDNNVDFVFKMDKYGFSSKDNFTINGKTIAPTGLTRKQETEEITIDGTKYSAKLFTDTNGEKVYKYSSYGETHYLKKSGNNFNEIMTVRADGSVSAGGRDSGLSESEQLAAMGISVKMHEYTAGEIRNALLDAYNSAFPDSTGSLSVRLDGSNGLAVTYSPENGKPTDVSVSGNIKIADTGYGGDDGVYTNYSVSDYGEDHEVTSASSLTFFLNGSDDKVEITGTGANGGVTIKDLTDSGYFSYSDGQLSVTGTNILDFDAGSTDMQGIVDVAGIFGSAKLVGEDNVGVKKVYGSNAQVTVNGVTLESASNNFSIDGVTFGIENVKEFTEDDIASGAADEITVDISRDNSKIKEVVTGFMEAYNELLDTINGQLTTARPKSKNEFFDPLTEEQEEEMDQDEIDKWNEKAKTGMLYHDTTLSKVFSNIRSAVSSAAVGGMTLQAMGIDTSSDYEEYGKLVFNDKLGGEAALDAAIEKYGDEIAAFFTDTEKGLGTVLNNAVNAAIDTGTTSNGYPKGILTSVAGVKDTRSERKNYMFTQMEAMQKIIDRLNERYEKQQESLWKQYSTLENYIYQMNAQSSSLFGSSSMGSAGTTA